jgi:hypothetical protein
MFVSCPHCRDLVATDPDTRLPPPLCARCGGALRDAAHPETAVPADAAPMPREPSLASFLRSDVPAQPEVAATPTAIVAEEPAAKASATDAKVAEESDSRTGAAEKNVEVKIAEAGAASHESANASAAIETNPAIASPEPAASTAAAGATRAHGPSFTRRTAPAHAHPAAPWQWLALVLLSLLLLLQVLVADRARLAADAAWRPLIAGLCEVMGCSMPAWRQPAALTMLSRDVRPIAGTPGGLDVQATFRNDARWAQAWPVLLLSLSDADGRVIGARAFTSREYLGADATQSELAPGQSARIALQLYEPDPDVVAFTFDFR